MANDTINNDSDSGIYAFLAAAVITGFICVKFINPVIIELNKSYYNLILTLTNNFVMVLILMFVLSVLIFIIFYKFIKKRHIRESIEKEADRIYKEKADREQKLHELREGVDYAHRHKDDQIARKLLREKYMLENDAESLIKLEMPYYILEKRKAQERENSDHEEEEKEQVKVNVDLNNPFYKRKNLNKHEIEFLLGEGYHSINYKSICTNKKENFIVLPRFNESLIHFTVIYDLAEYLDSKNVYYHLFTTKMPDVVMNLSGKRIALEVETGTVMSNMKKFREKLELLNQNYGENWYFIVTNRNKVKKYKQYGKVIDLRYLRKKIDKIIKKR